VRPIGSKGGGGGAASGEGAAGEFFGSKAGGNRFVYVVDCSGSMAGEPLARARQEVLDSVELLDVKQSFFVVFFSSRAYPQFYPDVGSKLLPATPKNRRRLRDWVAKVEPLGGTEPLEALLLALKLEPDAVFFLTDGQFASHVADEVRQQNTRMIPIHAIAFVHQYGQHLLEQMARDSGGTYQFVP
jgi:uncharacterized protein with von Willebrand factor type A (vWA) domain